MQTRLAAAILTIAPLMAFSPPLRPTEPAQQQDSKSWIPETDKAYKIEPPVTGNATPQEPSAYLHPPASLTCVSQPAGGPVKATREFVEAYSQAGAALRSQQYEDAVALIDIAAEYARGGSQWMAIEGIRIIAFSRLKNDPELIASIEAALTSGCLQPAQQANYRELRDGARKRLEAAPPQ